MKLNYKSFGSGPPLIILHGLFGMLDNWRTIARMLEEKYQCILVDLRNHGRSPRADEMNYQVMSADLFEFIEEMQLDHATVMGHSMGGKVAMEFALKHPDNVDKLIIVDISPGKYPFHHGAEIEAIQSIKPSELKNRAEAEDIFSRFLGNDQATIQFLLKNLTRLPHGGFEWKANMPVLIAGYPQLMEAITGPTVFEKPALFIRGGRSNSVSEEDWPLIVSLFPQAQLITIANAGHWVHADQPKTFKDQIIAFIDV